MNRGTTVLSSIKATLSHGLAQSRNFAAFEIRERCSDYSGSQCSCKCMREVHFEELGYVICDRAEREVHE